MIPQRGNRLSVKVMRKESATIRLLALAVLAFLAVVPVASGTAQAQPAGTAAEPEALMPDRAARRARPQARVRPQISVRPRYPYRTFHTTYPLPYDYEYPGPNARRDCAVRYVQEFRPSGTVIVPRMRCRWVQR
jgi:hypothetical protein